MRVCHPGALAAPVASVYDASRSAPSPESFASMDPSTIAGIWPILYAFFDASGQLDRTAMRRQLDGCVAGGATASRYGARHRGGQARRPRAAPAPRVGRRGPGRAEAPGGDDRRAERAGADRDGPRGGAAGGRLGILQPPPVAGLPELEYVRFLGAVADAVSLPVAIQNAPGTWAWPCRTPGCASSPDSIPTSAS